ncbi:hypothetical protein O7627_33735 [Solwaraspora sp. WMMD1047]|uniref:hypothetical protein n=1 Tax=Solwaraspora sp. WMMD1047 TaxID=3016102 RepID=UPI0024172823|nr:hypothetical protein [Solwaraspora sp. WMMD1047]MDG4834229.1 hypothetical protein [Solwaraspora sp. WMMD1047]
MRDDLLAISEAAFSAQQQARDTYPELVTPGSRPIAWFGDISAYSASPLRIMTTGLNPSNIEFPDGDPDRRFPRASGVEDAGPKYVDSLNAYFTTDPYMKWFNTYRTLLEGLDASFDGSHGANVAVHTDLFSPVPTSPTWSRLPSTARKELAESGIALWHQLVQALRPDVILLSVAEKHLSVIDLPSRETGWKVLHTIEQRRAPYPVRTRAYHLNGHPILVAWGRAANTPFGSISYSARREIGTAIRAATSNLRETGTKLIRADTNGGDLLSWRSRQAPGHLTASFPSSVKADGRKEP